MREAGARDGGVTSSLRVIFADDEEMARLRIRRLLEAIEGVVIVGEAKSGKDALALLDDLDVDLALLDVRMGLVSGLEAAERAADLGVEVIITTAHRDHAVEAYAHGAIDYLLKPLEPARLAQAIDRARARVAQVGPSSDATVPSPHARLPLEVRGEIVLISAASITHAVLEETLVRVFIAGSEPILTELSLTDLERRLPHLVRSHRRALLALGHVAKLRPLATGGYDAILHDGSEVPVSRQSARELRRRLAL